MVRLFPAWRNWDYRGPKQVFPSHVKCRAVRLTHFLDHSLDRPTPGGCLCAWCFCFWGHWWFLFSSLLLFLLCCVVGSFLLFWFWFYWPSGIFPISLCLILNYMWFRALTDGPRMPGCGFDACHSPGNWNPNTHHCTTWHNPYVCEEKLCPAKSNQQWEQCPFLRSPPGQHKLPCVPCRDGAVAHLQLLYLISCQHPASCIPASSTALPGQG